MANDETSALHELQSALHKYLSLGSGTPLYSEAESLSTAVSHALGAHGSDEHGHEAPDHQGESGEPSDHTDFRSARHAAKAVYGNGGNKGGTKADDSEQSQEDEEHKKKGSRPF
jgi:hypothetical protein